MIWAKKFREMGTNDIVTSIENAIDVLTDDMKNLAVEEAHGMVAWAISTARRLLETAEQIETDYKEMEAHL